MFDTHKLQFSKFENTNFFCPDTITTDYSIGPMVKSLSNDNQATKFTSFLTLLEAMLSTVKLRVPQR